jgi:hypothetical protein
LRQRKLAKMIVAAINDVSTMQVAPYDRFAIWIRCYAVGYLR